MTIVTIVLLLLAVLAGSSFYLLRFALTPLHRTADESLQRLHRHAPAEVMQWIDSVRGTDLLRDTTVVIGGVPAHALYMRSSRPTTVTALLVHGYKDCAWSMMHIAYLYHRDLGMNVIMPDLPAHGQTPGDHIGMGWGSDVEHVKRWIAVADTLFSTDTQPSRMVLHGISMGAATVMNVAADTLPEYVCAVIEDCGYTSAWDEFDHQLDQMFGLPAFPLLHTASAMCRMSYGWTFGQVSSLRQLEHCRLPMLFIHGDNDNFVPTRMVHRLYQAKPQPKQLWLAPGSAHARAYSDHPQAYTRRVRQFVAPALAAP